MAKPESHLTPEENSIVQRIENHLDLAMRIVQRLISTYHNTEAKADAWARLEGYIDSAKSAIGEVA